MQFSETEMEQIKQVCGDNVKLKPINDFGDYFIADTGHVFSRKYIQRQRVKLLRTNPDGAGYQKVQLCRAGEKGKSHTRKIHVLVAEHFIGPRPEGAVIRHLDGDQNNNNVANLCYGSHKENNADMVRHGRSTRGTRNAMARFSDEQIRAIQRRALAGENTAVIAKDFDTDTIYVNAIRRGVIWSHLLTEEQKKQIEYIRDSGGFFSVAESYREYAGQKLNRTTAALLKARLVEGASVRDIAKEFGVSESSVYLIKQGKVWRNVQPATLEV